MSKIRTFVAIRVRGIIPLEAWMTHLKTCNFAERIKWNESGNWHFTLKFIGDINESQLDILKESLESELRGFPSGKVELWGAGFFGIKTNPKVLWTGIAPSEWLNELKEKVEKAVSVLELPVDDRPFRPHLTLGRIKHLKDSAPFIKEVKEQQYTVWGEQEIDRVILFKSKLTAGGAVHSELDGYVLGKE